MHSRETGADAKYAEYRGVVGKVSCKTGGTADDDTRRQRRWFVVVFRVGEWCGATKTRVKSESEEKK